MVTPKNKIKNITKKDITKNIFSIIGLPRVYSAKIINDIIKILISNLIINNKIKIKNFGTFLLQKKMRELAETQKTKKLI